MQEINAEQELAFIKKVMEDSKKIIVDDGKGFIFWGILISFGLIFTYIAVVSKIQYSLSWFWPALIAFGWLYTMITEYRSVKRRRVSTFAGKIMGALWIACGVSMTLLGFAGPYSGAYRGIFINATISIVLAIGYYVTGTIYGVKWIKMLAFGWWIGGVIIFFWHDVATLLLMAGMMILFQVIPGIILFNTYKKAQNGEALS